MAAGSDGQINQEREREHLLLKIGDHNGHTLQLP